MNQLMEKIKSINIHLFFVVASLFFYIQEVSAQNKIHDLDNNNTSKSLDSTEIEDASYLSLWFQLGLGSSKPKINYEYYPDSRYLGLTFDLNIKFNKYVIAIGRDVSVLIGGVWSTDSYWTAIGYSTNLQNSDASVSLGPSLSRWKYNTENDEGLVIRSPWSLGFGARVQGFIHMKTGAGIGLRFSYNHSKEVSFTSINLIIALGSWYHQI